ncbi:MAG: hypothetical protein ABS58_09340 [Mesorhizobium sp. SCN 65-20]|nr:MAG: hypothetical protein ABS58_09340 [Mesorhizobium sp. SCN 65-20]
MNIKVRGLEFYEGDQGDRPFTVLAHGTVMLDRVVLSGVTLAWSRDEGATALAPSARTVTGAHAIRWDCRDTFAKEIAEKMLDLFKRMGGELPPSTPAKAANRSNAVRRIKDKRIFVPFSDLELSVEVGLPLEKRVSDGLDVVSEKRGAPCYTAIYERTEPSTATKVLGDERERGPDALAYDAAVAVHAASRDEASDDEAIDGLHRTLGICAVEETMARAGL